MRKYVITNIIGDSKMYLAKTTLFLCVMLITLGLVPIHQVQAQTKDINPDDFVDVIDNPFFPAVPGTSFIYKMGLAQGSEIITITITHEKKQILGVSTTVFGETQTIDGILDELSNNWFAQDKKGNVWYFGEDVKIYKDGEVVSTEGSWESGVNNAMPGIIMEANPMVGDSYAQENAPEIANDWASVESLNEIVSIPLGTFNNWLYTKEWSTLEPGAFGYKYYAPGLGFVLELIGEERTELIHVISPAQSGAEIQTNKSDFKAGDSFILSAKLTNGMSQEKTVNEYIVLDVAGSLLFWPNWTQTSTSRPQTLPANKTVSQEILNFTWPQGAGKADNITFWIFLLDPVTQDLFGNYGRCEFSIH